MADISIEQKLLVGATEAAASPTAPRFTSRAAMSNVPNDPACTCGSNSPRAYQHAGSCPHSTPWNDRVKARQAAVKDAPTDAQRWQYVRDHWDEMTGMYWPKREPGKKTPYAAPTDPEQLAAYVDKQIASGVSASDGHTSPGIPASSALDRLVDATDPEAWYCEAHPERLMGHDGCTGAGIQENCRIHMLLNKLRLAEQETRETAMARDDLAAQLRRAIRVKGTYGETLSHQSPASSALASSASGSPLRKGTRPDEQTPAGLSRLNGGQE